MQKWMSARGDQQLAIVAVLRLHGSLADGIRLTLEWRQEDRPHVEGTLPGALPPSVAMVQCYATWQGFYRQLGSTRSRILQLEQNDTDREVLEQQLRVLRQQHLPRTAQQLQKNLDRWLEEARDFQAIAQQLAVIRGSLGDVRLIVRTDDVELQRLPWHLWQFWQQSPPQFAIAPLTYVQPTRSSSLQTLRSPVRILTILGDDRGINLEIDRDLLKHLPNLDNDSQALLQPKRQDVTQALADERGWDILFFAGHSETEDNRGRIYLNENDSFTLDELRGHLQIAADNGLKICIFNSCDGLGLALQLANLGIPYCIYMREPVPDVVAHRFLEFFLESFSQGDSLHAAFLAARTCLESIQDRCPQATWLPVLFQQPNAGPLVWPQPNSKCVGRKKRLKGARIVRYALLGAIAVGVLFLAHVSWQENQLVRNEFVSAGEEILGWQTEHKKVASDALAGGRWQEGIEKLLESWVDDGRDPETLVYLNNALIAASGSEYRTIAVTVPFLRDRNTKKLENYALAYRLLQGVSQAQTEANRRLWDQELGKQSPQFQQLDVSFLPRNVIGENIALKVVIADDLNRPEEAVKRAKVLTANRDILGVVGHYASDMSKPSIPTYRKHRLPLISPGSTAKGLANLGAGYFFRIVPTTKTEAASVANYLLEVIGKSKVAVFYNPESPYTHSFWDDFKDIYTSAGGNVVRRVRQTDPLSDLASPNFDSERAIAALAQFGSPDDIAIILAPDGEVTRALENSFDVVRENAGNYTIVGSWGLDDPRLLNAMQNAPTQSLALTLPWHHTTSPDSIFSRNAEELWGQNVVEAPVALAYDATRAFVRALRSQSKPTRQRTRDALAAPDFAVEGATGTVRFETNGDRRDPPQVIIQAIQCSDPKAAHVHQIQLLPLGASCQTEVVE